MENFEEDLTGAIRNGIERGQTLESVKASLVNAGYNLKKIEEAVQKDPELAVKIQVNTPQNFVEEVSRPFIPIKPKRISKMMIIYILIFISILAIGGVLFLIFKDSLF
ncbi:MAG: hypothetical protein WC548_00105 [Candidatus Pacearchaeota archaeon]